jgi:hypothetical protein
MTPEKEGVLLFNCIFASRYQTKKREEEEKDIKIKGVRSIYRI